MRFTVPLDFMKNTLSMVRDVTSFKEQKYVQLELEGDCLYVSSSDQDSAITLSLNFSKYPYFSDVEPGVVCLDATTFISSILSIKTFSEKTKTGCEFLTFSIDDSFFNLEYTSKFKSGKENSNLKRFPIVYSAVIKRLSIDSDDPFIEISAKVLHNGVSRVIDSMGTDTVTYTLSCIQIELADSKISFSSTDGIRLSLYEEPHLVPCTDVVIAVWDSFSKKLLRILNEEEDYICKLYNTGARLYIHSPDNDIIAAFPKQTANFPSFRGLFDDIGKEFSIEKEMFFESLSSIVPIVDDDGRINLNIRDGFLNIKADNGFSAEASAIPVSDVDIVLDLDINISYLLDTFKKIKSDYLDMFICLKRDFLGVREENSDCSYKTIIAPLNKL